MTKMQFFEQIKAIISDQTNVPYSEIELSSEPSKFSTWDSLANTMIYLEIINSINSGISFEQYLECKNVGELVEAVLMASKKDAKD